MIITQKELQKLALITHVHVPEDKELKVLKKIESVLTYAARVQDIAKNKSSVPTLKSHNGTREDVVISYDADMLRSLSMFVEGNYFVVPVILK